MVNRNIHKARVDMCCWFCCVITVLSLAGVVAWLSLIPKKPSFEISDIHFPVLNPTNTSTPSNISVPNNSILFNLQVSNPNKRMGIYYSDINLVLYRGGGVVGTNSTSGFHQDHKSSTQFRILVRASQGFWQGMNGGRNVEFVIRVETAVRYRIIRWNTKVRRVEHEEKFRNVRISLNGTVSSGDYAVLQNASKVKTRN